MSCQFFLKNGYCTLGNNCKLYHQIKNKDEREKKEAEYANITEIAFSFDTTGSMRVCIDTVRSELKQVIKKLFSQISNIRIALIAHGDYIDGEYDDSYIIKHIDFTRDKNALIQFINNAHITRGGGDNGECYELCLWTASNKLNWTKNARSKALVIIGDDQPHPPNFKGNTKKLDWKKEIEVLKQERITCFGIYCRFPGEHYEHFYKAISKRTNGQYLELLNMKNITKLFVALCLKTSDDEELFEKYKNEILRTRDGDDEVTKAILSLNGMQNNAKHKKIKINSSIKRLMYDLKEIKREKLIDIAVVPEEGNAFKWHVNIKPIQGIFNNVYIHLTLQFPSNYPLNPPQIKLITKIPNNIHSNIDNNTVCLPLFGATTNNKSKYGSSWSAAYSIISLLVNISSIFGEIDGKKGFGINKLLNKIRTTRCNECGHCHNTPYPVLGANKLPFDILEINVNDKYYKKILQQEIKNGDKKKQKKIVKQEIKDRIRGILIAGNIIETVKNGKFWKIKSQQSINRNFNETVSWQFNIDMFERKKKSKLYSDFIFGFVDDQDVFFGVDVDGNVVFNNNSNYNQLYNLNDDEDENKKITQHTTITYILHLNHSNDVKKSRDQLFIFVNYNLIANISLPALYTKCIQFWPVMYLKDIRLHLTLDIDPKLNKIIQNNKNNKFEFNVVEVFNKLKSNHHNIDTNDFYIDQISWDRLLERALTNDILLDIFGYLSYSDLIHCAEVNTFWYSVLNGHNVLDRFEIRCFYTHQSIEKKSNKSNKCILGVGLNVIKSSNKWITSVETEMDFLSLSAYKDYNIKKGAWGETITHFLPLVINEKHSKFAKKAILNRISKICDEQTFNVKDGLMVITAIMNQFVVQLMANTIGLNDDANQLQIDPKHASEKALIGYCAFHHMLLYLVSEYPEMKKYAHESIKNFIENPSYREKSETPDLGKFLLNLAIVDEYKWEDIASEYVHESLDRHVKWYLMKFPKLKYLNDNNKCSNEQRIALTIEATLISRRLTKFQVFFLKNICTKDGYSMNDLLNNYNKRWGRPTNEQKNILMKAVNDLLLKEDDMNSWLEYFNSMGINKYKTNLQICNALKKAVINSKNKQYHRTKAVINSKSKQYHRQKKRNNNNRRYEYKPAPSTNFELMRRKKQKLEINEQDAIEMQGELNNGHNDWITCIKVDINNPNRIVTGSRDKSIIIWDEGKMMKRLKGHNHFISDIDISSDGNYILSASWDGLLKLWNTKNGKKITTFIGHKKDVLSVQFSPDNRRIVSCGMDKSINIWNTMGHIKYTINDAHNGWITCIVFSPNIDDNVFVSGSMDKLVKVWQYDDTSTSTYTLKHTLIGHKSCITSITISPDGSLCASGDKYGNVYLWDIDNGILLSTLNAITGNYEITSIVFSPNKYWTCFSISGCIEIWDLETKTNIGILRRSESLMDIGKSKHYSTLNRCNCIAWSTDGKTLYSGYSNNKIKIWKLILSNQ